MSNLPHIEELIKLQEVEHRTLIAKKVHKKAAKKLDNNFRILCLFCSQKAETNTLLGLTSLLMALGFLIGNGNNSNYDLIYAVLPAASWSLVFCSYASIKLASCLTEVNKLIRYVNSSIGIWAWMCIFLSFTLFDQAPIAPTEVLLLMPVLAEMWVMTSIFDFQPRYLNQDKNHPGVRKR